MELSVVIPVYNSEQTIGPLVARVQACLAGRAFELVLVNDGSRDDSERVCLTLAEAWPNLKFVSLRRNFGEFNAVLCGLTYAQGDWVTIIDDDFQNPPDAILTLLAAAQQQDVDVMYSRYADKRHARFRNIGSSLLNGLATPLLGKPPGLYLSSFKIIRRAVVNEIIRYTGPYPYIDALILRVTRRLDSVVVPHHDRQKGRSNYTITKLISLFLMVLLGYSTRPLRALWLLGLTMSGLSGLAGFVLTISALNGNFVAGWVVVVCVMVWLSGLHLLALGLLGEYVGKLFMTQSGLPPYVVKLERNTI
jgi:glycosyltransferase involved in cell wall biosynthesis